MEVCLNSVPDSINSKTFPAKLWRLINNPVYDAICWDRQGEVIVIDQELFEKQVLSSSDITSVSAEAFRTANFSSFVRQLNLYGFKKADPQQELDGKEYKRFYNPNFKRDHPELVARLWRLTVDNKAKLQAGLNVKCHSPSRYHRLYLDIDDGGKYMKTVSSRDSLLLSSTNQKATPPHYPSKTQAYTGTPIPHRFQMRGVALPLALFSSVEGLPVPLNHPYPGVRSSSNAVHVQQNFLAHANRGSPNFTSYSSCNAHYRPGYYSPLCNCYHPKLAAPHMAGDSLETGLFSPQNFYQAGYPACMLGFRDNNQCLKKIENQEVKNCKINMETVFKIADDLMPFPPNTGLVKVESQDEVIPELESSSNTRDSPLCDSNSVIRSISFSPGPTTLSALSIVPLVPYKVQCVESVPEDLPVGAIFEATTDHERDTDIAAVIVGDTSGDASLEM